MEKANHIEKSFSIKNINPFFKPVIQKKMSVGSANNSFEVEADNMATKVMRMFEPSPQNVSHAGALLQRKCATCEQKEGVQRKPLTENITPLIQRFSNSENGSHAPTHLENQINSTKGGGSILDHNTKTFMENRFGTDFSDIKIHTGSQAVQMSRELNAQAFTVGNDIYFNEGKYSPSSDTGKHLLAHELTHTVQQKGSDTKFIRRRNLTGGEFGTELNHYATLFNIPPQVFALLNRSATFMRMARALDPHYIALDGNRIRFDWASDTVWNPSRDGVLTQGPYRGRRVLAIWYGSNGSEFLPAGSLGNDYGYDIILLKPPMTSGNQEIGNWIEIIAHETTHCFTRNTISAAAGTTAIERITAAITDEVNTRGTETVVVGEATRRSPLTGYTSGTGSTNPADVQRDMFPSSLKSTYLEQFVFNELVSNAISTEGLSSTDIESHNRRVDAMSIEGLIDSTVEHPELILYFNNSSNLYELVGSTYDELRFIQRIINARWTRFQQNSSMDFDIKEQILQEHATAFFNGITSYLPRP